MRENFKRIIGLLLAAILLFGMAPVSAVPAQADPVASNVIGPLTMEEPEVDFGESDPSADLESEADFLASLGGLKLSGPYNERLLAVAETQLGYAESERNFVVRENEQTGKKEKAGYTRYGAWYGRGFEYESWCAMFISFCLRYAEVPVELMPRDSGVITWMDTLRTMGLYRARGEYLPKPGDLVFFDWEGDGKGDHVGIVSSLFLQDGVECIETIEGNHTATVERFTYSCQDLSVMGYGVMTDLEPEEPSPADYVFPQATVYLGDILSSLGISAANNSSLRVDSSLITLSDTVVKRKNLDSITLTASGYFDLATLIITKNKNNVQTVTLSYPDPAGSSATAPEEEEAALVERTTPDDAVWADDILYLTGHLPGNAVVDVVPVSVSVDGRPAAAAYDVKIYTNANQRAKGKTWQPADRKVQVHFRDDAFGDGAKLNVYHLPTADSAPEYVATVTSHDSWVEFEADSFSVYAFTVLEKNISIDGQTYKVTVSYDETAGLPSDAELEVSELSADDSRYKSYLEETVATLDVELSSVTYSRLLDIAIVDNSGTRYQPNNHVSVTVELLDENAQGVSDLRVVHFGQNTEELPATTEGTSVSFETDGFSLFSLSDFSLADEVFNAIFGDRKLYENDDIILTGKMPMFGSVEATPVNVEIAGHEALVAYDIKIYANSLMKLLGLTWQPGDGVVTVTVKSDALAETDGSINVFHLQDENSEPEIVCENLAVEDNTVSFDAKSFSVYALTPETYHRTYRFFTLNEDMQYVEYTLYTDLGTTTFTQNIKNGESLVIPQLPAIPGSSTSTFSGWYEGTGNVDTQPIDPSTITLSSTEFDFTNIPEITVNGEEVYLFARFADFAYVIFHDQYNGTTASFPVAMTRRGEKISGSATVSISDFSVQYDDNTDENAAPSMAFYGWSYTPVTTAGSRVDDNGVPVSPIKTDTITIPENVDLYPIFTPIHWLNYHSGPTGSGATYIPSTYYYVGEGPTSLSVPVRSGYAFDGWYTGSIDSSENVTYNVKVANADGSLINGASDTANGVSVSNGQLLLDKNATIYAKWIESGVNYTIVIWRQKSTDEPNLANTDKEYDYAESFVLNATTGTTVSVGNTYKSYSGIGEYVGFTYNRCDDSKTVAGDGSTVLNVYYDRNVHTLTFILFSYVYRGTTYSDQKLGSVITDNALINTLNGNSGGQNKTINGHRLRYYNNNYYIRINNKWYQITAEGSYVWNASSISIQTVDVTALSGASVVENFSSNGAIGSLYAGYSWTATDSSIYAYALATIDTMPDADVTFIGSAGSTTRTIYYYVEIGDASESQGKPTRTFNGKLYREFKTVSHGYNFLTYDEEFHKIEGYNRERTNAEPYFGEAGTSPRDGSNITNQNIAPIGGYTTNRTTTNNINYLYYDRETYGIEFLDSYTNTFAYVGGTEASNQLGTTEIKYSEAIANYVPSDPTPVQIAGGAVNERNGYSFTGWYTDPACSTRVFFEDNEEYRNYTRNKVLYTTMPAYNLRFYAGWETLWYKIVIDPNYGSLNDGTGTGSTWFWEPYNGDPIEEYTWVKRDYVEAANGTYFYHYDDRSAHGWGENWSSAEDEDQQRYAYYTTNQGEATDQSKTFKYAENAYRYAGWYEIDPETGEETLYNFGEPVTHDTYLILHWKKIGTYHVSYNAEVTQDGVAINGTIDGGDSNEELFFELDGDDYADNAEVVVGRTADAPEGYNFIGWKIRGDNSGKIYKPGQSFVFLSKYAVTMPEGETIFLDAVYTRVATAKIIYDANGGTIDEGSLDYGAPIDTTAPEPVTTCDVSAGTATIENLVNNSEIRLGNGGGFSMENATLVGWSESPSYNPETDTLFALGKDDGSGTVPTYYVDTEDPVTLYAVWEVKVYFHLNESTANANFGGTWDPSIYTMEAQDLYSRKVYINTPIDYPPHDPVFFNPVNPNELFFRYWGTMRYVGDDIAEYDFSQPVTDELHLYAYWAGPIQVPVHAVDASAETLVDKDNPWLTTQPQTMIAVAETEVSLAAKTNADVYASHVSEGYAYAFAAVKSRTADLQTISEDQAITALYYNNAAKKVYVKYKDTGKADAPLQDTDEIYLVYYKDPLTLSIGYKVMETNGSLSDASLRNNAGNPVSATAGTFVMNDTVNTPLSYKANNAEYHYYAYAIGTPNASNSSQLRLITESSGSDSTRPPLQIRNTWRGYQYSTDGGNTWTHCGYDGDIQLYVVYFETESQPTVVTINEKTIGTTEDMSEEFEYVVVVTETTTTTTTTTQQYRSWGTWYDDDSSTNTETSGPVEISNNSSNPYILNNNESQSVTVFSTKRIVESYSNTWTSWGTTYRNKYTTTVTTVQNITITQNLKTGFITSHEVEPSLGTSTQPYTWTYTTTGTSQSPVVTYTNIHTPLEVEVHVALVSGSGITLDDNERSSTHTITVPINRPENASNTKVFLTEIPANVLFTGDDTTYGFAGIIYGTSGTAQGDPVTVAGTDVDSITYAQLYPTNAERDNIYELTLYDDSSNILDRLEDFKIYYLYYPLPRVQYVKEGAGGSLTKIVADNANPLNSGGTVTLNGVTVTQNQTLPVGTSVFTITQDTTGTATNNYFNMPLILDDTTVTPVARNYLRYTKVGVGSNGATNVSALTAVTEDRKVMLKIDGSQVKWSLDGTVWNAFTGTGAPTIYAIYSEIGYDLRITKKVTGDGYDPTRTFSVTISSTAITESAYTVSGTGYPTIPATPANGTAPGTISLTVKHGSDITVSGLGRGTYTVTEQADGAVLVAKIGDTSQSVHSNSVDIQLIEDTQLDLENQIGLPSPTGITFRTTPFILMLGLGLLLALPTISRRRRRRGEADD